MDAISGLCAGCGRTLAEIAGWSRIAAEERAAIMAALPARLAALDPVCDDAGTGRDRSRKRGSA